MNNGNPSTGTGKHKWGFVRILGAAVLTLAVILAGAHFAWKYSGSEQWGLVVEKNGIKIYSMKTPGSTVLTFMATTRVKSTLSRAVAAMKDTDGQTCAEWVPGCTAGKIIQPWNERDRTLEHYFRIDLPFPLKSRDFVYKTRFIPDPKTKSVEVEFQVLPDLMPENACCIRVTHLHNTWRYTQRDNGELDVELVQDLMMGGSLPYFMFNMGRPGAIYTVFADLPKLLNKERYDQERFPFLDQMTAMN